MHLFMPAHHSYGKGFTLIELVVSVAIMGMLVGGGIAAYRTFNTKQLVQSAGKEFVQIFRVIECPWWRMGQPFLRMCCAMVAT
jgi:prepilin-type N-terminal cleavage/methylation domain-containing protein